MPLLCVEILSKDDRLNEIQERVDDYAEMGVRDIWVVNPWKRIGYHATTSGFVRPDDGVLRVAGTTIFIELDEIFRQLDEFRAALPRPSQSKSQ